MAEYDYLIVGAGLFGSVFARQAADAGKRCLVIDRRRHIGGNAHCEEIAGIMVHMYGAHIFHTSDPEVWEYVNRFGTFMNFVHSPVADYKGERYALPFNMNTFSKLWGVHTPEEARLEIQRQTKAADIGTPRNLEEQALKLVGRDIYETLIKGYTEKQWGRPCSELPPFILCRLPLRFTYDNNYFDDRWQGIPEGGYDVIVEKLLAGCDVRLGVDYSSFCKQHPNVARKTIYTGMIDEFFDHCYGCLEYRTVRFETYLLDCADYQGHAVVNYTDSDVPYTRIVEHKHFQPGSQKKTVISREYPAEWKYGMEPYYPINNEKNQHLYGEYRRLADKTPNVIFGGRLGSYQYFDMDKTIRAALDLAESELKA